MNSLWFLLLTGLLFLCQIETATSIKCTDTKKCECIPHPGDWYEFHCPPTLSDAGGAVVHVREGESRIQIRCLGSPNFKPSMFPKINADHLPWIEIKHCPLPRNKSLQQIITKLTRTDPLVLTFEQMESSDESLSSYHFEGLNHLLGLSLRSNKLQEMDEDIFINTRNLKMINLQENGILLKTNVFHWTPELTELDISVNGIESLPKGLFSNLKYLLVLHMWYNRLTYLDETTFTGLRDLRVLDISKNKIETIAEGTFAGLTKLTNLTLSENRITNIPTGLFAKNTMLTDILLESNTRLTLSDYALANLPYLNHVVMSRCNLSSVPVNLFSGSTSLRVLRLDLNRLQTLPEGFFRGLGYELSVLNLGKNMFKTIPKLRNLRELQELYLDYNELTRIDRQFEDLDSLTLLNLEHNFITKIDNSAFPKSLRRLSLAHNRYNFEEQNPFAHCADLEELDLSNNLITSLKYNFGLSAMKLKELTLNNNLIKEANFLDFQTVSGATIMLENNKITNIDFRSAKRIAGEFKTNPKIVTEVYLRGNPFKCDCDIYDLVRYAQHQLHPNLNALVTLVTSNIICAHPKNLEYVKVRDVPVAAMACPLEKSEECPGECSCIFYANEDKIVYHCASKNTTHNGELEHTKAKRSYDQVEQVSLQGNKVNGYHLN